MMKYFKDQSNNVHAIEEDFEELLPTGCVEITKEEADAIANPPPPTEQITQQKVAQILGELAALDVKRIRPLAEGDTAYLATLNKQAVELRAKLKELTS